VKYIVLVLVILFLNYSSAAKDSVNESVCGELTILTNKELIRKSEVQLNWGAGYSCKYIDNDKNIAIKVHYENIVISDSKIDEYTEKYISRFYAVEENVFRLKTYRLNVGSREMTCFDDVDNEKTAISKCFIFLNSSKINLTLFGKSKSDFRISEISFD